MRALLALAAAVLLWPASLGHGASLRKPESTDFHPLSGEARLKQYGIIGIKGFKTCGSTFVGSLWRMTTKNNVSLDGTGQVPRRNVKAPSGSYFVTMIRDPGERCLSELYYARGHDDKGPASTEQIEKKLSEVKRKDGSQGCDPAFQTKWLAQSATKSTADIFTSYDFVAVCERFDESLLLMGKKFGFSLPDLLYLKAKESGHWSDNGQHMPGHEPLHALPKEVQDTAKWLHSSTDAKLLEMANRALDREVQKYGERELHVDMKLFTRMLAEVEATCRKFFTDRCLRREDLHTEGPHDCGRDCIEELAEVRQWA